MEQEVLTSAQKKVIDIVANEPNLADFYLTGGTALAACYFQHRISDDLDFFIFKDPDKIFLHGFAEKLKNEINAKQMFYERLYDRNQFFFKIDSEELKIEFTKYPFKQLEKPEKWSDIRIDSLRDVAANKLMALLDRFDPKDFVDLYFLLQKFNFKDIRKDVEIKFDTQVNDIFLGGELAKARRIEALPKMLKPLTVKELKDFFSKKAKEIGLDVFEN